MPTACWASALALLCAGALADAPPPAPVALHDAYVATKARPLKSEALGRIDDSVLLLAETYASRPAGMSRCQAGEERFLRVVRLLPRPAKEMLRIKTASCREDIELADSGVSWSRDSAELRIDWLQGPAGKGAETRRWHVERDGRVREIKPA